MPKRIPFKVAKEVAESNELDQVIIFGWDGNLTHVVTYGKTVEDCDMAASGGNEMKKNWGWPEEYLTEPSRVKKLKSEIKELKDKVSLLERQCEIHEQVMRDDK